MANHALPTTSSLYVDLIAQLDARLDDASFQNDPVRTTVTNPPTGLIRWRAAVNKWELWDGAAYVDLTATYAISISGNAGTATTLATPRAINGVNFNGSAPITVTANTGTNLTFNNSGSGAASGSAFNGGTAVTVSYNTVGAPKADGTGATGTWSIAINGNASSATTAGALSAGATIASDATATTQAVKDSTTKVATTAFVDRLRSLLGSATTGTAVLSDRGCLVSITAGFTIPASVFAAGDVFVVYNNTAGNLTLSQGSGGTQRLVGTASAGNRTLAQRALVTVTFISATEWVVSGGGLS